MTGTQQSNVPGSCTTNPALPGTLGPAGLQLARHFEDAGRDYLLFERGPSVATFYRKQVDFWKRRGSC